MIEAAGAPRYSRGTHGVLTGYFRGGIEAAGAPHAKLRMEGRVCVRVHACVCEYVCNLHACARVCIREHEGESPWIASSSKARMLHVECCVLMLHVASIACAPVDGIEFQNAYAPDSIAAAAKRPADRGETCTARSRSARPSRLGIRCNFYDAGAAVHGTLSVGTALAPRDKTAAAVRCTV